MSKKKALLMILDGWGKGDGSRSDVIATTETPNFDRYMSECPNSELITCGEDVGLPAGQMGNSEVGHLNIGAGRIVYQDLVKINKAIADGSFFANRRLLEAFNYAKANDRNVHLLGLVSDGGVHSSIEHLFALIRMSDSMGLKRTFVHVLTDGRDTDPHSSISFLSQLNNRLYSSDVKIASLVGRYYTMDRDKRWDRIKAGYDLMVHGVGEKSVDAMSAIYKSYVGGVTDEFIKPVVMVDNNLNPLTTIQPDDVVICFNFRTDRLRQITIALTQQDMPIAGMHTLPLHYYTMTRYDEKFVNVNVLYEKDNLVNTLGEVVSSNNMRQLRIAETEKYAHVTFFFSGGREKEFVKESRLLIASPKVATYDLQPEMSAPTVKDALIQEIKKNRYHLIVVNFANGDMVGHTGVYKAIQKAVKTIDKCIGEVVEAAKHVGYTVMIIADHGNADFAVNNDGTPNTAHSLNPVPCILINSEYSHIDNGILADVAPTLLKILGLEIPEEMTGKILVE